MARGPTPGGTQVSPESPHPGSRLEMELKERTGQNTAITHRPRTDKHTHQQPADTQPAPFMPLTFHFPHLFLSKIILISFFLPLVPPTCIPGQVLHSPQVPFPAPLTSLTLKWAPTVTPWWFHILSATAAGESCALCMSADKPPNTKWLT